MPAQNLGPRGTLCSTEFLPLNAVRPQIVVLDAFCEIKNKKIDFGLGFAPDPTGGAYTALPYPIAGGEGSKLPPPCPRNSPPSWPFGLADPCLLTFDDLLPPLPSWHHATGDGNQHI